MILNDREFERLVHDAMTSRPEPAAPSNLTARAIGLARQSGRPVESRLARIERLRRRNRWVGLVAAAMIAVVLLLGGMRLSTYSNMSFPLDATNSDASASGGTTSGNSNGTESEFSRPTVLLTGEGLLAGLVLLSVAGPLRIRNGAMPQDLVFD